MDRVGLSGHMVQEGEGVVSMEVHEDHGTRGEMGNQVSKIGLSEMRPGEKGGFSYVESSSAAIEDGESFVDELFLDEPRLTCDDEQWGQNG